MEKETIGYCTVCSQKGEVKFLPLYTIGSEGTYVCHRCDLMLVAYVQEMIRLATVSRKIGYQNAKDVQKSKKL